MLLDMLTIHWTEVTERLTLMIFIAEGNELKIGTQLKELP